MRSLPVYALRTDGCDCAWVAIVSACASRISTPRFYIATTAGRSCLLALPDLAGRAGNWLRAFKAIEPPVSRFGWVTYQKRKP